MSVADGSVALANFFAAALAALVMSSSAARDVAAGPKATPASCRTQPPPGELAAEPQDPRDCPAPASTPYANCTNGAGASTPGNDPHRLHKLFCFYHEGLSRQARAAIP